MYFPWTVCDYPLAQVVEDRIVKAPLIVTNEDDAKQPMQDPDDVTRENVCEKYGYWIHAAVQRWQEHSQTFQPLGTQPVLFIMAEKNAYADAIGAYLWKTEEFGFKESEVLVIHTDQTGEVTQKDLDKARQAARDIDKPGSPIKAIVSVMLREVGCAQRLLSSSGSVLSPPRRRSCPSKIGRGLRLMTEHRPRSHPNAGGARHPQLTERPAREQLEAEGVGVATTTSEPPRPVISRRCRPPGLRHCHSLTKPHPSTTTASFDSDPAAFEAIYDQAELEETFRINLKLEFATTETGASG
jgi:type III restriction enzyme